MHACKLIPCRCEVRHACCSEIHALQVTNRALMVTLEQWPKLWEGNAIAAVGNARQLAAMILRPEVPQMCNFWAALSVGLRSAAVASACFARGLCSLVLSS